MAHHAYDFAEAAWLPAEFVTPDGTFDVERYERWVEEIRRGYGREQKNLT